MLLDRILEADLDFFAAFSLIVILLVIYLKKDVYSFSGRMFKIIIITNIFLLIFEGSSYIFNGVDNAFSWYMNYSLNSIIILGTPLIGCFFAIYIDHKIYVSKERLKKRLFYFHPLIIGVVLSIANFFAPVLFTISSENVYSREPFIFVNVATLYILLFYIFILVFKNRKTIEKHTLLGTILFMIFPAIGGVLQMTFYGLTTIFPMMSLGIIASYIFMETISTSKDFLTNLYTRAKAQEYMRSLIDIKQEFAIIMIDIDDLKKINDNFGHVEGDKYLKFFAEVLLDVFVEDSLVSRRGGDEFLIVTKTNSDRKMLDYKQKIKDEINKLFNKESKRNLKFGFGYSFYKPDSNKTVIEIESEADNNMYKDKAINKNQKRRKSDF